MPVRSAAGLREPSRVVRADVRLLPKVTDARGNLQAGGPLPSDYQRYRFIDVTEVAVTGESFRTGQSVLRGPLRVRDKPVSRGTGRNRITLLADIPLAPLPGGTG